jgi:hypothetical protein
MLLYRYDDFMAEEGITLRLRSFEVARQTDKTYFIKMFEFSRVTRQCRKGAVRSFAYDNKEQAFNSYMQRKTKQAWHAKVAMQTAELSLKQAMTHKDLLTRNYGAMTSVMGKPEFYEYVHFD